jgi:transcriptional regulator with XRE-family HTH domain
LTFAIWQTIIYIYAQQEKNMLEEGKVNLGAILRQQRLTMSLTLQELATKSDVSASHLGRIERGERFPSAAILRKIAKPLAFHEDELFTLAGYLSAQSPTIAESQREYTAGKLDPYVSKVLSQESVEVQRAVIGILTILKSIAKSFLKERQ